MQQAREVPRPPDTRPTVPPSTICNRKRRNHLRRTSCGCNSRVPHHFPTLSTRVPSDGLGSSQKFPFPKRPLAQWNEYRTAATEALSILIGAWPTKSTSPYLASEAVNPPASTQTQKPTVKIRRRRRPHAHRLRLIASHRDRPRTPVRSPRFKSTDYRSGGASLKPTSRP